MCASREMFGCKQLPLLETPVFRICLIPCLILTLCAPLVHAQSTPSPWTGSSSLLPTDDAGGTSASGMIAVRTPPAAARPMLFSAVAVGVNAGVLGIGLESATPLSQRLNLRAGSHFLNLNEPLSDSGVNYNANLHFRSAQASVDWFPWARSFHLSGGALLYNGNRITASAVIPAGESFTINSTNYVSSAADPVHGSGGIRFAKAAPMLTAGWGNLLPRSGKHFSFPFEAGFAYVGDPKVQLSFAGTVCDSSGQYCQPIPNDAQVQANVAAEQARFAHDASYARFFPVLSSGFSYRF
jgi:hypothetical protein